jgi:hypothetical protein
MECHEDPYIRGDNQQLLEEGMAYTVEPGIYLAADVPFLKMRITDRNQEDSRFLIKL